MRGTPVVHGSGVTLRFGGVTALDRVDVQVRQDELLAVIGPNGAGKTSLLNVLSGFYRPQAGSVTFNGADITGRPTHAIARMGIARTLRGTHLFSGMTALDNIVVGRHFHMHTGIIKSFVHFPWTRREEIEHRAGTLGYGLRKRVDLARALAMEPRLLLMDEPMAGMNAEEKEDLARFVVDIREARRIPVLLVEHDMSVVMDLADRVMVLDFDRKIGEGPPAEIQRDAAVISAYLGAAR